MLTLAEKSGLTKSLKRFWELESLIAETENTVISREEEVAVADFNRGLNLTGRTMKYDYRGNVTLLNWKVTTCKLLDVWKASKEG